MNKNINRKVSAFKHNDKLYKDATNQKKSRIIRTIHTTKESEDDENELNTLPSKECLKYNNELAQYNAMQRVVDENIKQKGNFILEKFLSDAVNKNQNSPTSSNNSSFSKQPVPLPRKNKNTSFYNPENSSSNSSGKTYSISSPKIDDSNVCNDTDRLSIASGATYNIDENESKEENAKDECEQDSTSSGATYNINENKNKLKSKQVKSKKMVCKDSSTVSSDNGGVIIPVGDILIHNSPTSKSSVKVVQNKPRRNHIYARTTSQNASPEFKEFENEIKYHSTTNDDAILGNGQKYNRKHSKIPKIKKRLESDSESTVLNIHSERTIITDSETDEKVTVKYKSAKFNVKTEPDEEIELQELSIKKERKSKCRKHKTIDDTKSKFEDETNVQKELYTCDNIIGITVYKTDQLLLNSLINHPCVKVHIVDSTTGEYMKRSTVLSNDNNDIQNTEYIEPSLTKPYNLQEKRSLIPQWEELLTFNEDFNYMLDYENCVIFFEILDFLTFSTASVNYRTEGTNSGWYKVAWAFLKPVGKNGHLNTEKQIRLQMYKPKKYPNKNSPRKCILFEWWTSGNLTKYPSTLYVNVKKIKSDIQQSAVSYRELNCDLLNKLENEAGESLNKEESTHEDTNENKTIDNRNIKKWARIPPQSCKIPNKIEARFKSGNKGCLIIKFSNDGSLLAAGVTDVETYPIFVYSVFDEKDYCKLSGHQGLIYDLHWSNDDKYLISASADCTVYIWNVTKKTSRLKQLLPHPSFVYCAQLNTIKPEIATGCYDQIVRIWKSKKTNSNYELSQELDGHLGYVTSMCFGKDGALLYSSDSKGVVIEWTFNSKAWILQRTLKFRELQNTVINNIVLHPQGKRLLLFCRDSIHRMVDLSVGCVIQWFRGALNNRVQMYASISPCGGLILAPSEDGSICIWNTDTGILQATYMPYSSLSNDIATPHCIQYNPQRHAIAICHYGSALPILFAVFEKSCTGVELQLRNCTDLKEKLREKSIIHKDKTAVKATNNKKNYKIERKDKNVNLEVIIEKIDEVLTSARTE